MSTQLTPEQMEMKLMILEMTLGIIAKNERNCPDIETARRMANDALEKADAHVTRPPPKDVFEAYGLTDGDAIIDARNPDADVTVGDIRREIAEEG